MTPATSKFWAQYGRDVINFRAIPKIQNNHGFSTSTNMALHKKILYGRKTCDE